MDATPFEWFNSSEKFSLHGAIDDATGNIVGLYMTKTSVFMVTGKSCDNVF